jgi:mono/diheme cytochrome c family protein
MRPAIASSLAQLHAAAISGLAMLSIERMKRPLLVASLALLAACGDSLVESRANPADANQVALGAKVYAQHCAACHGAKLEGQPNWRSPLPTGRMPAPPHDESGHTWHHTDEMLFGITKEGLVPGKYAPPGHQSDMPAFGKVLSDDEIWAVLAYIKSHWKTPALLEARKEMVRNARNR